VALVRRTDFSEENIGSIFEVKGTMNLRSEDIPPDGQRRKPLGGASPQSCYRRGKYPRRQRSWTLHIHARSLKPGESVVAKERLFKCFRC
jgi:hypothetical protein